jgi:ribonucleoside-diphosphate reductase beta chain
LLRDTREVYRPFEYPDFEIIHNKLMSSFWTPYEVQLGDDVVDYKNKLTADEREIINRVLKNFVQSEIHVGSFWGDKVSDWFKKPEIQNVARYISGNETIHASGYDLLNSTLGLNDYDKLKEDKQLYARIQMLNNKRAKNNEDILKQIFLYSVMGEGVSLFSSFLTIFAFTKKNLLKGVGQIVSWSTLDEQLHSDVGCLLFNTFKKEYNLMSEDMKKDLIEISKEVVKIEHNLVDRVFENSITDVISKEAIKNYVNDKANKQLKKVGLTKTFKVDKELLQKTEFFDIIINGASVLDFFSSRETAYSKGVITFGDDVWGK